MFGVPQKWLKQKASCNGLMAAIIINKSISLSSPIFSLLLTIEHPSLWELDNVGAIDSEY